MPNTYSSAQHFVGQLSDNYRIGIQCGQSVGSSPEALAEMKWITFAEFKSYARQGLGNFANYRGPYSNALPEDAVQNDYFNATGTFTVDGVTYESGHVYEYNGSSWGDVTNVFSQFITLQQAIEAAQGQINELALLKNQLEHTLSGDPGKIPASDVVSGAINSIDTRVTNIEETLMGENEVTVQYPDDGNHPSLMPNKVPLRALKFAEVPRFRGKSREWNQFFFIPNTSKSDSQNGLTLTDNRDGSYTVSGTATADTILYIETYQPMVVGHVCYLGYGVKCEEGKFRIGDFNNGHTLTYDIGAVYTAGGAGVVLAVQVFNGATVNFKCSPTLHDLTLIFGSGNEPSTVADALAQLSALGEYNPYDAGSIISTEYSGAKAIGRNLCNNANNIHGYYSIYGYDPSNEFTSSPVIKVTVGKTYSVRCFDLAGNLLANACFSTFANDTDTVALREETSNATITIQAGERYIRVRNFSAQASYSQNNNIKYMVNEGSTALAFVPYKESSIAFPSDVELRGIGDCIETCDPETGVLDDGKFGLVDLGGIDWTQKDDNSWYTWDLSNSVKATAHDVIANIICSILVSDTYYYSYDWKQHNGTICVGSNGQIGIYNTAWNGKTGEQVKTILSGVYLLYEKATYTPSQPTAPILDPFLEVEGGGTVETIQTQSPVIDNCLDVTYDIIPQ